MNKITIRLKPDQQRIMDELHDALGTPTAVIVRAIIGDFLSRNEEILERIIENYLETGTPLQNNNIIDINDND